MFFAVIGDIKSNFSGLNRILDVLENEGIQRVLHTGNVCASPAGARECVELLRRRTVRCVQGKVDRELARLKKRKRDHAGDETLTQTHLALGSIAIEYLHGLPRKRVFVEEGLRIVMCHGAVSSASEILTADTPMERFRRERELEPADIIICGGAARPFAFNIEKTLFVCPGIMTDEAGRPRYTLVNTEDIPWLATSVMLP